MLFIGGSKDGKRMEIESFRTELYFLILPEQEIILEEERKGIPDRITYKRETYKLQRLHGEQFTFEVMALKNFTGDNIVERLIENYNPKCCQKETPE